MSETKGNCKYFSWRRSNRFAYNSFFSSLIKEGELVKTTIDSKTFDEQILLIRAIGIDSLVMITRREWAFSRKISCRRGEKPIDEGEKSNGMTYRIIELFDRRSSRGAEKWAEQIRQTKPFGRDRIDQQQGIGRNFTNRSDLIRLNVG